MENEEARIYYVNRINSEKLTGYLFGWIPFPPGSPLLFLLSNTIFFAFFGVYFDIHIILFIVFFPFAFEIYSTSLTRNEILDNCLTREELYQWEFITMGVDPNFPDDPLYITNNDREDIFDEFYQFQSDYWSFANFKKHYFFILSLTLTYIVVSFLLAFGFNF